MSDAAGSLAERHRERVKRERRVIRERARAQMRQLREWIDRNPDVKRMREQRARRRRIALMVILALLLLLLLLLQQCPEGPGAGGPPIVKENVVEKEDPAKKLAATKPTAKKGRIATKKRPAFVDPDADAPPWLPALRLQVAARSPRLARCFEGVERPGGLRWTAVIDGQSGVVFEQELSSDGAAMLTSKQRACVTGVLASPAYHLAPEGAKSATLSAAPPVAVELAQPVAVAQPGATPLTARVVAEVDPADATPSAPAAAVPVDAATKPRAPAGDPADDVASAPPGESATRPRAPAVIVDPADEAASGAPATDAKSSKSSAKTAAAEQSGANAEKSAGSASSAKSAEKATDRPAEKPVEKPVEKRVENVDVSAHVTPGSRATPSRVSLLLEF